MLNENENTPGGHDNNVPKATSKTNSPSVSKGIASWLIIDWLNVNVGKPISDAFNTSIEKLDADYPEHWREKDELDAVAEHFLLGHMVLNKAIESKLPNRRNLVKFFKGEISNEKLTDPEARLVKAMTDDIKKLKTTEVKIRG